MNSEVYSLSKLKYGVSLIRGFLKLSATDMLTQVGGTLVGLSSGCFPTSLVSLVGY